ncbi:uncharacterized protein [Ptychodera flava]|uniref:uncharacterized protein n=1 Tax=Ptychodera flava TaxID=63121 RepID=UPI00396A34F4
MANDTLPTTIVRLQRLRWFFSLLLVCFHLKIAHGTVYLSQNCDNVITSVGDELYSQQTVFYSNKMDCTVTLWATEPWQHIHLYFEDIDFEYDQHSKQCLDYVRIYDGGSVFSPLVSELCGRQLENMREFTSTDSGITLRLFTDHSVVRQGFHAIFTAFYNRTSANPCDASDTIDCLNCERCISSDLACDGLDHCSNQVDELGCKDDHDDDDDLTSGEIAGIVIGSVLVLIIILIVIATCLNDYYRKKRKRKNTVRSAPRTSQPSEPRGRSNAESGLAVPAVADDTVGGAYPYPPAYSPPPPYDDVIDSDYTAYQPYANVIVYEHTLPGATSVTNISTTN